jgi:hypothetical protein
MRGEVPTRRGAGRLPPGEMTTPSHQEATRRRLAQTIVALAAVLGLAESVARGGECEERCYQRERSCLDTNAAMRLGGQYPSDQTCTNSREACLRLCMAQTPPPPRVDPEVLQRQREARDEAERRAEEAHRQDLEDSFKRTGPKRPVVSQEQARLKNACLTGDNDACQKLRGEPPDRAPPRLTPPDTDADRRRACQHARNQCQHDCSAKQSICWKSKCDPIRERARHEAVPWYGSTAELRFQQCTMVTCAQSECYQSCPSCGSASPGPKGGTTKVQ